MLSTTRSLTQCAAALALGLEVREWHQPRDVAPAAMRRLGPKTRHGGEGIRGHKGGHDSKVHPVQACHDAVYPVERLVHPVQRRSQCSVWFPACARIAA